MAEVDPLSALQLEPGERVLWQGRPRLGAAWSLTRLARAAIAAVLLTLLAWALATYVLLATLLLGDADPGPVAGALGTAVLAVAVLLVLAPPVVVVLGASKVVGPFYGAIALLGAAGLVFCANWLAAVDSLGWNGAVEALAPRHLVALAVLVGLPLARLVLGVTRRLAMVVVITDRRVAAVRTGARAATLVWEEPLPDGPAGLRLEGAADSVHLAVGRRALHLRDEDPARLLADLRGAP